MKNIFRLFEKRLRPWYDNLNLKQRIIIWCVTVLLSLFPVIGWFLISPWLIVLLYCEYKRPSKGEYTPNKTSLP